ncbi:MAG: molecular chaperone HtpG [Anaerolineae bacterium]|nr:molecular chaperone HtpG [Anaerolineae bacterium]
MNDSISNHTTQSVTFKAETRQLLNILIHSLYANREVFLRELISNASDALTRIRFEQLTNQQILDPEAELAIWIEADNEKKQLIIRDSGIGMTSEELAENLGTIAHSGARAFLEASMKGNAQLSADIIGQFGVGFYSAFMVAEWIRVRSRSYRPDAKGASWFSSGDDTYTIVEDDKADRGTEITIQLKEDAHEFADEYRLSSIIKKHSNYIPFPIYLGKEKKVANQQTALWRQPPQKIEEKEYHEFYKQFTLDIEPPIAYTHLSVDAPVQLYAVLYIPASAERSLFSLRREDGLELFARKILIQEYCKDLLPEFLRFVQGVVDSEDLPLNVSRETIHSTKIMAQLKRLITSKVIDLLKNISQEKPEDYKKFWKNFRQYIKEGVATSDEYHDSLLPLLRFKTLFNPEELITLDSYVSEMKPDQKKIYYILGEDERSLQKSPHLEVFKHFGYDVLLLTDPLDPFMLLRLQSYKEFPLANAASEELKLPAEEQTPGEEASTLQENAIEQIINRFKTVLGERVTDIRVSDRLIESPARLIDSGGASTSIEMQRLYRMLGREVEIPKKALEINPKHAIIKKLSTLPADHPLGQQIIEQIYENALLVEGLHPDPTGMIARIQNIIEAALD